MKQQILDLLIEQYNKELEASFAYQDIANWAEEQGLKGMAKWFTVQSLEELEHANLFAKYIRDRDERPKFRNLELSTFDYETPLKAAETTLAMELEVTKLIHAIMDLAKKEADHATVEFLSFFIKEQVEEEATAKDLISRIKLAGDNMFLLDNELATRGTAGE